MNRVVEIYLDLKNLEKEKGVIQESLRKMGILNPYTEHITINCFGGAIVDIKPTLKMK